MTAPDIVARRIGTERQPIAIVDHFHPDADSLRRFAKSAPLTPGRREYPGVRAELPDGYFQAVRPALSAVIQHVFAHRGGIALLDASFSIVTTPPSLLSNAQRLPHFDAVDPARIALVHYLTLQDHGGTAFYRHRATGFETIGATRATAYLDMMQAEIDEWTPAPAYIDGSTGQFEQVSSVDARYNRAVVYRSALLHSGLIPPGTVPSDDPTEGRLTITAFLQLT